MNAQPRCFSVWLAVAGLVFAALQGVGCSKSPAPAPVVPEQPVEVVAPPVEEKPDPNVVWSELMEQATAHLEADALDETDQCLTELAAVFEAPLAPSETQQTELADLQARLDARREALAVERREADLVEAERLLGLGKLTEAVQKINEVKALSPTAEQRTRASAVTAKIERIRRARRDLQSWLRMLGSERARDVSAAQSNLLKQPEIATGMLLEAAEDTENPVLAGNALGALRRLNRPDVAFPAMIGVLQRTEQQPVWPVAIRELVRMNRPGAGQPLLDLALTSQEPQQRDAALTALAQVDDPPNHTLVAMLPLLQQDGPELASALRATYHALRVHDQYDLPARRGLDAELSAEQEQAFATRLEQLMALPTDDEATAEVVQAAKVLACATHQLVPQPLPDVQVRYAEAESDDGPAAAVLDGVWNSVDLTTMWRHPVAQSSTILLDLGATKTVVGVRIWNFNQAAGAHRGWKNVDVFVSDSTTEADPVARGIVPPAPGAAETPDYSTLVPVPFVRGRFVRLEAKRLWNSDTYTGLSEIQIIGF